MKNFPFIKEIFIALLLVFIPFSLIAEAVNSDTKSNKPKLEILKFDNDYNIIDSTSTDKYLLVPVDKNKLKKEANQSKLEDLSRTLIKETPKPLTTQLELKSKLHINSNSIFHKILSNITQSKKYKMIVMISLALILIITLVFFIRMVRKRRRFNKITFENSNLNQTDKDEIITAINEFEEVEEKKEKLEKKKYINDIDKNIHLDGFKKDVPPDFIIKNIESLEKNQKNDMPLSLVDKSNLGFKKQKYVFDEKIGYVSDEEGLALFEDEDSTSTLNNDDFEVDYYDEPSEKFYSQDLKDDIFILEEDLDDVEDYAIVDDEITEEDVVEIVEETQEIEEQKVEDTPQNEEPKKSNEQPFKIIDKYQLSDTKGFALLSYNSEDVLIGYINSRVIVLKKFDKSEKVTNLSVRIYEEIGHDITQYLVKIGMFKGVIEVSDDSIKLVLNL